MHIVAVDILQDFTDIASDLTRRAGLHDKVTHVQGNLCALEGTGDYDGVFSFLCYLHIQEKDALFGSIAGTLKPGMTATAAVATETFGCICIIFFGQEVSVSTE